MSARNPARVFSNSIAEKFLQPRMPRPAHVALWLSEGGYTPRCRCGVGAKRNPTGRILLADTSNGLWEVNSPKVAQRLPIPTG